MILGTNLVADTSAKVDVFGYISPIIKGQKNNLLQIKEVGVTDLDSLSYTIAYNFELLEGDYGTCIEHGHFK